MWYCYTSKARYFVVESFECCACLSERSGRAELFIEVKVYPVNFIILQCGLSPPVCWTSHTSCFNNLEFTIFQQQQGALVFGCQLINLSKIVITVTVLFLIHSDGVILITQWRCYSDHSDSAILIHSDGAILITVTVLFLIRSDCAISDHSDGVIFWLIVITHSVFVPGSLATFYGFYLFF